MLVLSTETPISSGKATRFQEDCRHGSTSFRLRFLRIPPGQVPGLRRGGPALGRLIADEGWRLVYGAGDVGLMGEAPRPHQAAGARRWASSRRTCWPASSGKRDLTTLVVTEDMHERKKVMFMNSDAVVVLPGGAGTLDEFFEVLTWRQIGLHRKPIYPSERRTATGIRSIALDRPRHRAGLRRSRDAAVYSTVAAGRRGLGERLRVALA